MPEYLSGKIRSGEMDARRAVVIVGFAGRYWSRRRLDLSCQGDRHDRDLQGRNHRWCSVSRSSAEGAGTWAGCRTRVRAVPPLGFDGTPAESITSAMDKAPPAARQATF